MASFEKDGMTVVNNVLTKCSMGNAYAKTDVVIPEGVTKIAENAFQYFKGSNSTQTLVLASTSIYNPRNALPYDITHGIDEKCKEHLRLENSGRLWRKLPTVKYIGDYACYGLDNPSYGWNALYLPDSVISIGEYAFSKAKITGVRLNEGLKTIGAHAFYGSSLWEIVIPRSVTAIRDETFSGCRYLKYCEINHDATWGNNVFYGAALSMHKGLYVATIRISNVTKIPDNLFHKSISAVIRLSSDIKRLGDFALGKPHIVYFGGTLSQWRAVQKGQGHDYLVKCTDGQTGKNIHAYYL